MEKHDVKELRKELKKVFIGYRTVTKSMRKRLKHLGFHIEDGGKHYKIINAHNQCVCIISKTPSDFRSGYNAVSDLCNTLMYVESMCIA